MKCGICRKEQGDKEIFWTHSDGKLVCIDCLDHKPKSLHELNEERRKKHLRKKSKSQK